MSEKLNVQEVMRLGLSVGLSLTEYESADICSQLDRQINGLSVLNNINTDGVQPMFDVDCGEQYKLARRDDER